MAAIFGLAGLFHSIFNANVSDRPGISDVEINRVASNIKSDHEFQLKVKGDEGKDGKDAIPPTAEDVAKILKGEKSFQALVKGDKGESAIQILSGSIHLARTNHDTPRDIGDTSVCDQSDTLRGILAGKIEFEQPFDKIPKVLIGLSGFEFNHTASDHIRLYSSIKKVDKSGFNYELYTWCRTNMRDA